MEKFKTDGTIIMNEQGDCMGIFSAVNLLNIRAERFHELEKKLEVAKGALEKIASEEYGRPTEMMVIARATLKQLSEQ